MANVLKKALSLITGNEVPDTPQLSVPKKTRPFKKLTERELIQLESEIGRELFGPVPKGHRREFFNLDKGAWIWYEEYKDADGLIRSSTTRYEVQDQGILKAQDGARYDYIEGEELKNFIIAVEMYYERVAREIYHRDPDTGEPL